MPNWKKVVVSGSDATLNSLEVVHASGSFSGSFQGDGSGLTGVEASAVGFSNNVTFSTDYTTTADTYTALYGPLALEGDVTISVTEGSFLKIESFSDILYSISSSVALTSSISYLAYQAETASFIEIAQTASFVENAQTASFVENAQTASYVQNSISASYILIAETASYVVTAVSASYVKNAETASYVATAVSASYVQNAETASFVEIAQTSSYGNNFTASSLFVEGTASITYLEFIYETSSIIYSSGSTKFGDDTIDTHERTGSLEISGSLFVIGNSNLVASQSVNNNASSASLSFWQGSQAEYDLISASADPNTVYFIT
jgi:hypothetical protein